MNPTQQIYFLAILLIVFFLPNQNIYGQVNILLYTETSGYNHGTEQVSKTLLDSLGTVHGFEVDLDNTGESFNEIDSLNTYNIILWANTSGANLLDSSQQANFEQYMAAGGNMMGIHAATDTYRHSTANGSATGVWDWYAETLGASVQSSPNHTANRHQNLIDHVSSHISIDSLPSPWEHEEEYYYWENGFFDSLDNHVLLKVRETNRSGVTNSYDSARAVSWVRNHIGGGKVFYTSLGHHKSSYEKDLYFKIHIRDALLSLLVPPPKVLDINWEKLELSHVQAGNLLSWATSSDILAGHFLIERTDGKTDWKEIGRREIFDNSQDISSYSFVDSSPTDALLYYRIGFQTLEGDISYSKTLSILSKRARVLVLGNPFEDRLIMYIDSPQRGDFHVEVMDTGGKRLLEHRFSKEIDVQELQFETEDFPSGIFFLKVSSKDFNFAQRIIKQ